MFARDCVVNVVWSAGVERLPLLTTRRSTCTGCSARRLGASARLAGIGRLHGFCAGARFCRRHSRSPARDLRAARKVVPHARRRAAPPTCGRRRVSHNEWRTLPRGFRRLAHERSVREFTRTRLRPVRYEDRLHGGSRESRAIPSITGLSSWRSRSATTPSCRQGCPVTVRQAGWPDTANVTVDATAGLSQAPRRLLRDARGSSVVDLLRDPRSHPPLSEAALERPARHVITTVDQSGICGAPLARVLARALNWEVLAIAHTAARPRIAPHRRPHCLPNRGRYDPRVFRKKVAA